MIRISHLWSLWWQIQLTLIFSFSELVHWLQSSVKSTCVFDYIFPYIIPNRSNYKILEWEEFVKILMLNFKNLSPLSIVNFKLNCFSYNSVDLWYSKEVCLRILANQKADVSDQLCLLSIYGIYFCPIVSQNVRLMPEALHIWTTQLSNGVDIIKPIGNHYISWTFRKQFSVTSYELFSFEQYFTIPYIDHDKQIASLIFKIIS